MVSKLDHSSSSEHHNSNSPPLNCPRCDSTNTKFCYYNNYSLAQPRHLCKSCKRYWTRGGTLRNVPIGGASRKNKRSKKSSQSNQSLPPPPPTDLNSLLYSFPPIINSSTLYPPVPEFEENFLADFYSMNSQMVGSSGLIVGETYQSLMMPCDDKLIEWPQVVREINPLEATSSGGVQYWNRPESGSSVAPLI